VLWLLVAANVIPSLLILFTLMTKAIHSSIMLGLTRVTLHHIPEDDLLHSHWQENLKSYVVFSSWLEIWMMDKVLRAIDCTLAYAIYYSVLELTFFRVAYLLFCVGVKLGLWY
jgi:hypothetical protein